MSEDGGHGPRVLCDGADLVDGGKGVRFTVENLGRAEPAFAVRFRGRVHAYLNRCAHVPAQMDWNEGEFFSYDKQHLICATHGATYDPRDGRCAGGPCNGRGLLALRVEERGGVVYLIESHDH